MANLLTKLKKAKLASYKLSNITTDVKNAALILIANELIEKSNYLIAENEKDLKAGETSGLSDALLDRLLLTEKN